MSSQSIQDLIHRVKKGFAYDRNGYKVDGAAGIFATSEEAEQTAREVLARQEAAAQPAPAAAPVVADRQAMRVGGMIADLGITGPAPKATGRCHYCGQRLDRNGRCEECI